MLVFRKILRTYLIDYLLVSIPRNNAIDANVTAEVSEQIGKLPFKRPLPTDKFIDIDLNVPTLRPMEIDEMIYFAVHPPTSIVPNKESGYDDEEPGRNIFFERCSNSFPKRMILSRMICPF